MVKEFLNKTYAFNSVSAYFFSLLLFMAIVIAIKIFRCVVLNRLKKWAEKTATTIDDLIISFFEKTLIPLMYFGGFYISINSLSIVPSLKKVIDVLGIALLTIFTARLITSILAYIFEIYLKKQEKNVSLERSMKGILKVIKFLVWGLAVVFFLDNLGFKISTVIAGLGIGGVAVGLAAQAILKDLFSYFAIIFDRPFEVGDFIIVDDYLGTVEYIGAKTTRIRSLSGEQLIFSNTDLTDSRLRNYKRMARRRVVFRIGVTYDTPLDKLKEIPVIIEKIVKGIGGTIFDRAHFFSYGDFSLIFEIVYYVIGSDYNKYMDIQQAINLKIKEEFVKRKIDFAFPTQTVYFHKLS